MPEKEKTATLEEIPQDPQVTESEHTPNTNAVVYSGGSPLWDFAAKEVVYPLLMEQGAQTVRVNIHMLQQTDDGSDGFSVAYKRALKDAIVPFKMKGEVFEMPNQNTEGFHDFVDDHFLRISAVSVTDIEVQKKYLNDNSFMKTRIFRECIQGIATLEEADEDDSIEEAGLFSLELESVPKIIPLGQDLISDKGRLEEVVLFYNWGPAGQKDYRIWQSATRSTFHSKKKLLSNKEDYDKLEALFNARANSVTGALLDGDPLTSENRDTWIPYIPLEHKLLVLNESFKETQVKNR